MAANLGYGPRPQTPPDRHERECILLLLLFDERSPVHTYASTSTGSVGQKKNYCTSTTSSQDRPDKHCPTTTVTVEQLANNAEKKLLLFKAPTKDALLSSFVSNTMSSEEQGKLPESVTVGDAHPAAIIAGSAAVLVLVACGYHFFEKDVGLGRGENWRMHLLYWVIAVPIIVFVPATINQYIFSNLTQTVVGVALPIYESVRAVCTPEEEDDKMWLQYWMLGGIIFMLTTWVDDIIGSQLTTEYWYECMIFLFYWLYFPKTQGAVLVYNRLTKPFIAPLVRPVLGRMNNFIAYMYKLMVNAVHLWLLWFIFMFLPSGLQRMIAIAVGTVYPLVSSISAASTLEIQDDTYWLTYWSVYGVLFLIMDILYVQHFVDSGFQMICSIVSHASLLLTF